MADEDLAGCVIVKVGGSLFDLPDLGPRLENWLQAQNSSRLILVPGGGATADTIRALDRCHLLGEERAHWLALAALGLNARVLAAVVRNCKVAEELNGCPSIWSEELIPALDPFRFAASDEGNNGALPHSWSVTSDSIAARIALVCGASRLVLLKSATIPPELSWGYASLRGFVDGYFPQAAAGIKVSAINFRDWRA
jgi:aspartokinase-like uncharacterized kinase